MKDFHFVPCFAENTGDDFVNQSLIFKINCKFGFSNTINVITYVGVLVVF